MVLLFYTTFISVDRADHEVFRAEVCKGGIKLYKLGQDLTTSCCLTRTYVLLHYAV